jgi:hypothetical protein
VLTDLVVESPSSNATRSLTIRGDCLIGGGLISNKAFKKLAFNTALLVV